MAEDGVTPLGVDLTVKHLDVRKLIGKHVRIEALDADDLLQEIYAGIWRKNHSASAWDPRRASFGKYVILVGKSIAGHMLDAPRWRADSTGEETPDVADEHDPIEAFEYAEEAAHEGLFDLAASLEARELVRQPWQRAIAQRSRPRRVTHPIVNHGQQLLRRGKAGACETARAVGARSRVVSDWRTGRHKPNEAARALLRLKLGIPIESWDMPPAVEVAEVEAAAEAEAPVELVRLDVALVELPAVLAGPAAAPRYRNEGQRLLRVAVEIHGRAEVARAAGVVVGSIAQWLGGLFKPGAVPRALLLAAYAIPVDAWDLEPLLAFDAAPAVARSHVELVAQLRASLAAHELADVAPSVETRLDVEASPALRAEVLEEPSAGASPPAPIRRSRLRGAVSFYFNDLAAAAVGPLAGYDPFAARASTCSSART